MNKISFNTEFFTGVVFLFLFRFVLLTLFFFPAFFFLSTGRFCMHLGLMLFLMHKICSCSLCQVRVDSFPYTYLETHIGPP